jgi:hypothetical protein
MGPPFGGKSQGKDPRTRLSKSRSKGRSLAMTAARVVKALGNDVTTTTAATLPRRFFEDVERFHRARLQEPDGRQNAVILKRLSFLETYVEGFLWIALKC